MKEALIGIAGLGTVGKGTLDLLTANKVKIETGLDISIKVKGLAEADQNKLKGLKSLEDCSLYSDAFELLDDPSINIAVELIGGETVAKNFVKQAVKKKKHVVTANKALLAKHGRELFELARENGVLIKYEASIGGGIPIVKALQEGLAANNITFVAGIINGTTNYILSEMEKRTLSFDSALNEAKELGYAELDPSLDIDGFDTAHKISLLASLAFKKYFVFENIFVRGIRGINLTDVEYAKKFGFRIKLMAFTRPVGEQFEITVEPTLIPSKILIAHVDGAMNAVSVSGDFVGHTLYYGQGAGAFPTASAVASDIMDIIRLSVQRTGNFETDTEQSVEKGSLMVGGRVIAREDIISGHYLRLKVCGGPDISTKITSTFTEYNVKIERFFQDSDSEGSISLVFLTGECALRNINQSLERLGQFKSLKEQPVVLRVETEA